ALPCVAYPAAQSWMSWRAAPPRPCACHGMRPRSRAPPEQNRLDGGQDDVEVERDRHVLDVEQVVLQLLQRVLGGRAVGVAHLRPSGQPGTHDVAQAVEGDVARE